MVIWNRPWQTMIDHGRARYIRLNISSQLEVEVFWGVGGSETQKFETYRSADFPDKVHQLLPYSDFIFTSCTLPWKTFQNFRVPGSNNGTALMYGKQTIYFIKNYFWAIFLKFLSQRKWWVSLPPLNGRFPWLGFLNPSLTCVFFGYRSGGGRGGGGKGIALAKKKNWIWDFLFRGQL